MSDVFSTFDTEVKSRHEEMLAELESISVDDLKAEGLSLTFGGKTFKFTDLEIVSDENVEEKLRKEFKEKLNTQQQRIRDKINSKINQLLILHQQKQQELDRKEAQMKKKYSKAAMMPDITEAHLLKGLSIVKGKENDELTWIYRGVYNPRFIVYNDTNVGDKVRKPIPSRLVSRMKKDMIILIKTKGSKITSVSTKKPTTRGLQLPSFQHYHQMGHGDCWGNWKYDKKWNHPDDILLCAKDAEAVLETINNNSLAIRNPAGLPRIETLIRNVKKVDEVEPSTVELEDNEELEDVWQTI